MIRRRIACGLLILAALIMYIFDNESVTLALLLAMIACPAVSVGMLALSGKDLRLSMTRSSGAADASASAGSNAGAQDGAKTGRHRGLRLRSGKDTDSDAAIGASAESQTNRNTQPGLSAQGATAQPGLDPRITISIENPSFVPIASVETEVTCENLRTGETDSYVITDTPRPRGTSNIELEVMPRHAGRYRISASAAELSDPLKLAGRKVPCEGSEYLTVMPEIFDMQLSYASDAAMLENDRSSDSRRGNDPGEVRSIREYVAGDPVRNIHWKLSEKMDKLLVKELGNPITDQFLVILDTATDVSNDPAALEIIASVFTSLAEALRQSASSLSIAWTDPDSGRAVIRKIQEEGDLESAADEYLAMPASMHSAFGRIQRDIAESRYAHIVIVSSRVPDGIEAIANGCQVTVLIYGESAAATENNVTTVGFGPGTYKEDLAGIEI